MILDGELYRHGWTLDRIAEAVSLFRRRPIPDTYEIGFYVFDLVDDAPLERRVSWAARMIADACDHARPVPVLPVDSLATADQTHAWNLRTGFEGTIYRTGSGGYKPGRYPCLLKRKEKRGSGFVAERDFRARVDTWG